MVFFRSLFLFKLNLKYCIHKYSSLWKLLEKSEEDKTHESLVDPALKSEKSGTFIWTFVHYVWKKEWLRVDMCTDEVIRQILEVCKNQIQNLTSDAFQSMCTQLLWEVLIKKH